MNAVDHNNVVIFDDRGIPSIMCRFVRPKDTEEVPAVFKIGDKVADAIYISKYPNIVIDGRAYSMPMADPTVNITFDGAVQACRCKGLGWHLMTAVEYEYLLNQSREKGTMPHGNTDWGKDYYHKDEQGKVSNLGRTYTGTGPVTWNHDHTPYGVSDLNGNVWEWLAGLRIKDGVIEFIPGNKAASPYCDLSKDSTEWQQAETSKGPVRANVEYGGRSIMFEAKRTSKDRITRNVLTDTQMDVLEKHSRLGALCGVCICIQDDFFFIPWNVWRDMKEMYGRQYLKPDDIEEYKVKFDGAVHFLMHTEELKGAYENAERKR